MSPSLILPATLRFGGQQVILLKSLNLPRMTSSLNLFSLTSRATGQFQGLSFDRRTSPLITIFSD